LNPSATGSPRSGPGTPTIFCALPSSVAKAPGWSASILALFDALAQDTARPKSGRDLDACCTGVARADLADDLAQAPGRKHAQLVSAGRADHRGSAYCRQQKRLKPHHSAFAADAAKATRAA
jgi:hypothetical protein